jgi:hypothetical protein
MSSSLLEALGPLLQGDTTRQVSRQLGIDEGKAGTAVQAAVPLLVTALQRNAASPQGRDSLLSALDRDHDGSILDDIGGFLGGGGSSAGEAILGHVLGGQSNDVAASVGKSTGLDAGSAMKLLAMLAPLVMGALGRTRQQQQVDAGGLADLLGGAQSQMSQTAPDLMSALGGMLDTDKDGSVIDDVAKIAGSLGGLFGRK